MQSTFKVRQATLADADELARLRWDSSVEDCADVGESFFAFVATFRTFVAAAVEGGMWAIWVVSDGSRRRGTVYVQEIAMVPRPNGHVRAFGYVTAVYLEPSIRNQGVGSRLLDAAIESARARGLESLVVWPSERSVRFYERRDFKASGNTMELELEQHP